MITIYCFVNARLGDDAVGAAVCATCGAVVGEHMSSNDDYARYDMTRSHHNRDYEQHAKEQHGAEGVEIVWLDKPGESSELRALLDKRASQDDDRSGG